MKTEKIKITFVLPNLLPGGAERVISYVSQNINPKIFNTTLLIIGHAKDASYDIQNIELVFLEKPRVSKGVIALIKFLRKTKPDIVVSANGHLNTLMAYVSFFFPKTQFISREVTLQTLMKETFHKDLSSMNLLAFLSKNRYKFLNKIICQSQDMLNDIEEKHSVKKYKLVVINNPITDKFKVKENKQPNTLKHFITVGRLSREKGHSRILTILSKLDYNFHYTIIGDGAEKETIFNLISELGISDKITHIKFTKEIDKHLAQSDLFLQGSFYEGFPNALMESCAVGTPVLAFNVPGGTKEIIKNGINGYMVDSEEDFLEKMKNLQDWNPHHVSMSVTRRFNKSLIIEQYEDLFKNILKQSNK